MSAIPMVDLKGQYASLRDRIEPEVARVLAEANYIQGPEVKKFEQAFATWLDVPHAVGVANGTDALHIALRALDIGPGDEVITTAFSFFATTGTISLTGARPVFVDIDPVTYNIDVDAIEARITPRTRAIVPVHLYGQPAPMDRIMDIAQRHSLAVVEDCAQSAGAAFEGRKTGTIGTIGCFSFFPSKNLGCAGDGGMVVTHDAALAAKVRALAAHGSRVKYHNEMLGFNSRLDTVQAAILAVKLPHLDGWNRQRRAVAALYRTHLAGSGVALPEEQPAGAHVYHQFTIRHPRREAIREALQHAGIASAVYYPIPLHLQRLYAEQGHQTGEHPQAEQAAHEVLSLPMYPELTEDQVRRIAAEIRAVVGKVPAEAAP